MRGIHSLLPVSAFALLHCFAPAPLEAQDALVSMQLDSAVVLMAQEGFIQEGNRHTGALPNGGSASLTISLRAGTSYAVVGVCDQDCTDMDLALFDASGNLIGADYEVDDVPLVAVVPTQTGTFRLDVTMPACSIAPCAWGVIVFRSGGEAARSPAAPSEPVVAWTWLR
jgi:hypothetical protein